MLLQRRIASVVILAASTAAGVWACQDFEELRLAPAAIDGGHAAPTSAGKGTGGRVGMDGAALDGAAVAPGCPPAREPAPPTPETVSPADGGLTVTAAIELEDLGEGTSPSGLPDYPGIGWDLDGVCTGFDDAGSSCIEPWWASANHADGPGGRDNAFGAYVYDQRSAYAAQSNQKTASGEGATVVRVTGYNGQANDDRVVAEIFVTDFQSTRDRAVPLWDGADTWNPISLWVAAPSGSAIDAVSRDPDAYVTGGVLVLHLDDLMVGVTPAIHLRHAIMSAALAKDAQERWTLGEGTIAGRVSLADLLSTAPYASSPTGETLCDPGVYQTFKRFACAYADVTAAKVDDDSLPCDAMSWAWRFSQGAPVTLGTDVVPYAPLRYCEAGALPSGDTCDTLTP